MAGSRVQSSDPHQRPGLFGSTFYRAGQRGETGGRRPWPGPARLETWQSLGGGRSRLGDSRVNKWGWALKSSFCNSGYPVDAQCRSGGLWHSSVSLFISGACFEQICGIACVLDWQNLSSLRVSLEVVLERQPVCFCEHDTF